MLKARPIRKFFLSRDVGGIGLSALKAFFGLDNRRGPLALAGMEWPVGPEAKPSNYAVSTGSQTVVLEMEMSI